MSVMLTPIVPAIASVALRTPTLPPATHTNAYVLGTREVILVEPASPYEDEIHRVIEIVDALKSEGRAVKALFATHHHSDHIGGASHLRERLKLPLWAHRKTAARIAPIVVDHFIEDGDELLLDGPEPVRAKAILTPGHAPGHLCLFEEKSRALIAGDMVASVGTILIEPFDGDMILYLESLRRLRTLDASVLLPAHGEPIWAANEKIDQYLAHRLARENKVIAGVLAAPKSTLDELLAVVYADTPKAAWPFARLALEAHLIKLQRDGRAIKNNERWTMS